jgi:Carboxypeptidase regulatory-like domain
MTAKLEDRTLPGADASDGRARRRRRLAILSVVATLLPLTALAQGYGRMTGIVSDSTGAVVQGASVTATQVGTRETTTTTTGKGGLYVFPSLRPASYDLSATREGFGVSKRTGIVLQADAALTINVSLNVGATSEALTVEAEGAQVNLSSATLSQVVDERRINSLPLNGRNAAALTTLVAGVVIAPPAQADQGYTKTFPVAVVVSANGSRAGQTNYMLDGGNNLDEYTNVNAPFPFPDALQEFSVQTSNYGAQYGQNAGGVVNIVTKSGTDTFHGSLFEYNRNEHLNAANYFSPGKARDPLKRNQFGGTLGGPIKRERTFFFAGYQKTILRNNPLNVVSGSASSTQTSAAYVPTQDQRNGIFAVANASQCVKNPFTGVAYPCTATATSPGISTIDPTTYNSAALELLKHLPSGDASGTVYFRRPTRENLDEAVVRVDHALGKMDRLTVRYFYDRFHHAGVLDPTNLLTYADDAKVEYQNFLVSETHIFSDRVLNTFTANYQRNNSQRGPLDGGVSVADLGVNIWQPAVKQINQIQTPGFTIGDNPFATFKRHNFTISDDLHVVTGAHSFAFGAQGEYSRVKVDNQYRQPGTFTFTADVSNNAVASFLLGYVNNFQQASGQFFNNRGKFLGVYAHDSWKVHPRLTLSLGLRYEPFFPWHELDGRMGAFSPTAYAAGTHSTAYPNAPVGLLFPGDPGMLKDGIRAVYADIMPRVGFAWDVLGTGKTSVRGGAGLFYDTRLSSVFNNIYSNSSPFITNFSVNRPAGGFSDPYAGMTNPFPAQQPPLSSTAFPTQGFLTFDPNNEFVVPRTWSWNLILEHRLGRSALARLAYVGSRGEHMWAPLELNPTRYDPATQVTSARVYAPAYTQTITAATYDGTSKYHALQATLELRHKDALTVLANYTYSKATDDLPFFAAVTAVGANASYVLPIYEPDYKRLDRGRSDFDRRHVAALSYVWSLPKPSGSGVLHSIFSDWQTSGIVQYQSGGPLTAISGSNNNSKTSQSRDRAVMTGEPYGTSACTGVTSGCVGFLQPSAFTVNPVGTYGTYAKGSLTGPDYFNWDVSLVRHVGFSKRVRGEFRVEFFNVLNHANFLNPSLTAGSGSFGRITGAQDPRIGQLSLKVLF